MSGKRRWSCDFCDESFDDYQECMDHEKEHAK